MSFKELEHTSSKIAIFRGKQIRKIIQQGEWYFSIMDVIGVLTESTYANRYWSDLKIQKVRGNFSGLNWVN